MYGKSSRPLKHLYGSVGGVFEGTSSPIHYAQACIVLTRIHHAGVHVGNNARVAGLRVAMTHASCQRYPPLTGPRAEKGRCKATWKREFKLPWREAGPPNHHDDREDSY